MTPKLSPLTRQLVEKIFAPREQAEASRRLIDQCGDNLPLCKDRDEFQMERIRFAALKISRGNLDDLQKAIDLAKIDWRDELMEAGFGERLDAHQRWAEQTLRGDNSPSV